MPYLEGDRVESRRARIGVSIAGCGMLLIILICVGIGATGFFGGIRADQSAKGTARSWSEAATKVPLQLYAPAGAGEPSKIVLYASGSEKGLQATYADGLKLSEFNTSPGPGDHQDVRVPGADQAYYDKSHKLLVLRKGKTWLGLEGRDVQSLVDTAGTLRRVPR